MNFEQVVPWIISCVSIAVAVYFGTTTKKRAEKQEIEEDSTTIAKVMVKLESISDGIKEIKLDTRGMQNEMKDFRERLAINEQSIKSLHKRVDAIEHR